MLAFNPFYPAVQNNRGVELARLGRYEEALASYNGALAIDPDCAEALSNRGDALRMLGHYAEALAGYTRAQALKSGLAYAHWNEGICRLQMGDYPAGWKKYEWRLKIKALNLKARKLRQPRWLGAETLHGRTILLHAEQGLGDTIQFVRYAPLVAAKGATVLLDVPGMLAPLMARLAGVKRVLDRSEALPAFDFHCPLPSLPLAFGTTLDTVPASNPYLSTDSDAAARWRARLAPQGQTLVGVAWRGSPGYAHDRERSIRFADFARLMALPGVRFVSLQKELTWEECRLADSLPQLVHPGADFRNTAEAIAALDLVISVDTAWAHWAGAVGKPLWVLLPFVPHWTWLTEREDSPWYPTARLFRQPRSGDWTSVIRNAREALAGRRNTA